jgi:predicted RNA-binding Zn ribbon-like protein
MAEMTNPMKTQSAAVVTAPGDLGFVHAFLNTRDNASRERFDTPERLALWLAQRSIVPAGSAVKKRDFDDVRDLREALREIVSEPGRMRRPHLARLNELALNGTMFVRFGKNEAPELASTAQAGIAALIARVLAAVFQSSLGDEWSRMKMCRNPECGMIFYDRSKNKSAVWCSTSGCGNRLNARAYRSRIETSV